MQLHSPAKLLHSPAKLLCLELFETFEEPDISYSRPVTTAVIVVYTWSIFQFTLVTTATIKDKKDIEEDLEKLVHAPRKNQVRGCLYYWVFLSDMIFQICIYRELRYYLDFSTVTFTELMYRTVKKEIKPFILKFPN